MTYDKLDDVDEFAHPPVVPLEVIRDAIDEMNMKTDKCFLDLCARIAESNQVRPDGRVYGAQ